jgi:hypothetical protein
MCSFSLQNDSMVCSQRFAFNCQQTLAIYTRFVLLDGTVLPLQSGEIQFNIIVGAPSEPSELQSNCACLTGVCDR